MAMHGVVDAGGGVASFFYLGALAEPLDARQAEILCMLAPHLHRVLLKLAQSNRAPAAAESTRSTRKATGGLTRREAEILKWIYHGKTNSETAVILGISELTVRNHMQKLMLKMGVGNRTQAVVKALQNNIFSDDPVPK
jgi:DNA-binding CsgD family transcriptional regulator